MNRKRVEAEKGAGGGARCMGRKNPNVKTGEWGSGLSHCTMSSSSVTQINEASEEEDEGPATTSTGSSSSSSFISLLLHNTTSLDFLSSSFSSSCVSSSPLLPAFNPSLISPLPPHPPTPPNYSQEQL